MITVGIDPGLGGAVAILCDGKYLTLLDMPVMLKGTGTVKNEVDASGMWRFLRQHLPATEPSKALLERVGSMPGQGISSAFSLGDSFGCCRAVLACAGIPHVIVHPAKWKKHFSLTSDKEQARALAIKLFPEAELHLKKYVDRAEALLMARYLYEIEFA